MRRRTPLRRLRHLLEGAGLETALAASRTLGIDRASDLGGRIFRTLGPRVPLHRTGERNLRRVLPELADADRRQVLQGMWENLGRVLFEFPHLRDLDPLVPDLAPRPDGAARFEVHGLEILEDLQRRNQPAVFASAHLANWEMGALVLVRAGLPMTIVYRQAENPWANRIIQGHRPAGVEYIRKWRAGRALLEAVRHRRSIGVLNDQKLAEGPLVELLGVPARTAPAAASLALRESLPLLPLRVERREQASFRITIEPALPVPSGALDRRERTLVLLRTLNDRFSAWIRARPDEWLWVHRRWPEPDL